jgi:hypothetical protein
MSWGYIVTARDGRVHLQHGDVILYEGVMPRRVLPYAEIRAAYEPVRAVAPAGTGSELRAAAEEVLREMAYLYERDNPPPDAELVEHDIRDTLAYRRLKRAVGTAAPRDALTVDPRLPELAQAAQDYLMSQMHVGVSEETQRQLYARLSSLIGQHLIAKAAQVGRPTP